MAQGSPDGNRNILSWRTIWVAALIVLAVTIGSGLLLFLIYPPPGSREALDIIRTAGTLGVGTGGAGALLLHARRQRSTEEANEIARKTNDDNRYDAEEKRVIELQAQANEQLGSEKASVRHGALVLLKRLANKYPAYRQDVADILCAYLRRPFKHPRDILGDVEIQDSALEELQVRMAVQRLLTDHVRVESGWLSRSKGDIFWDGISLDLRGAILVDFDLSMCRVESCNFNDAKFLGQAIFAGSYFGGHVEFCGVHLENVANFTGSYFLHDALFDSESYDDFNFDEARVCLSTMSFSSEWPMGWTDVEPKCEKDGRLEGEDGRWGYVIRNPEIL